MLRFLILDDDPSFRQGLRYHLEVEWPDAAIEEMSPSRAGRLADGFALGRMDLVLLGHPAGDESGLDWLRQLTRRADCPPVVLFAAAGDEFLAVDALKAGAANYFPKDQVRHRRLVEAIHAEVSASTVTDTAVHFFAGRVGASRAARPRIRETLYSGDLTSVYLAEQPDSGEPIVFKVLKHGPERDVTQLFDRFLQEYEVIARISHPHVVRIFDLGVADDHAYIAMEYLSAGSLAQRLGRPLTIAVAVRYAIQIADALSAVHAAGVLHRDLKPGNILFRDATSLALIDFGLAKQMRVEVEMTGGGRIFGTPHYMSPEQGHARRVDERSDLYSLGCILYHMLTGERPFTGDTPMAVIYRHAQAPRPRLPDEAVELQPLLDRLLAVDPAQRVQSAQQVVRELQDIARRFSVSV